MPSFWKRRSVSYDFRRLIDTHNIGQTRPATQDIHIICDIDKTYLETSFETVVQMAKIAFEDARQKVTVNGASDVLLAARWAKGVPPKPLHFVSSSPPQLRSVLEEKLMLDGVDWDSDTFKNQAYNLRKGRMDLLKHHVAYKSAAILSLIRHNMLKGSALVLIGDNAESDTLIYLGIKFLLERRLSEAGFLKYLETQGVEPEVARDLSSLIHELPEIKVAAILIRSAPGYPIHVLPPLTDSIHRFQDFFEAAMHLAYYGYIAPAQLWPLARKFHNRWGFGRKALLIHLGKLSAALEPSSELYQAVKTTEERLLRGPDLGTLPEQTQRMDLPLAKQELTEDRVLEAVGQWMQKYGRRGRSRSQ